MRLGIELEHSNTSSYSSAWQALTVPADAVQPRLGFWYHASSDDTAHDVQYAMVQDEQGSFVEWILLIHAQDALWRYHEFSLDAYRGRAIRISFGVHNDGLAGTTALYVDDVSAVVCGGSPLPSAWAYLPVLLKGQNTGAGEGGAAISLGQTFETGPTRQLWATDVDREPDWLQAVAQDAERNTLYVAAGRQVLFLDSSSGLLKGRVDLGSAVRGLATDAASGRVYAALWNGGQLAVLSSPVPGVVKVISGIPGASGVAMDASNVYVSATASDELVVVDKQSLSVIGRVTTGDAPYVVVCDEGRRLVYVGNAAENTITVVDGGTAQLYGTLHLHSVGPPHGLALDPQRGLLYLTYALGKYRAVAAIDASTGALVAQLVGNRNRPLWGAYGVAVDPLRGWVYLPALGGALVLHGQTLEVLRELPGVGPVYAFGWAVDAVQDRLYIVDAQRRSVALSGPSIEGSRGSN
jgi:DNA-binding beta-propeller fold protein YncE